MRHIVFSEESEYPIAILIKESGMKNQAIIDNYIQPLENRGIDRRNVVVLSLDFQSNGKAPVSFIKKYLVNVSKALNKLKTKVIYVTDGSYFKAMTKVKKLEGHYGYKMKSAIDGFDGMDLILGASYTVLFHNPDMVTKMVRTIEVLADVYLGKYKEPGKGIIESEYYPDTPENIKKALKDLLEYPRLSCDIEAFSLRVGESGIATITFCWSETQGLAFACDYKEDIVKDEKGNITSYGIREDNPTIRAYLKEFFLAYEGELIYHGVTYDSKMLAYELFMEHPLDYENQVLGCEVLTKNVHCTNIIAYLATNNAVKNKLGLKDLAQEYAGNWAEDSINDVTKIPLDKLLKYNLIDGIATYFVFNKYYLTMVIEEQLNIYQSLFLPMVTVIINAEITGMPMADEKLEDLEKLLVTEREESWEVLNNSGLIKDFVSKLQQELFVETNNGWKTKTEPLEYFADKVVFNPASNPQLQNLIHNVWEYEVTSKTDSGAPAVGAKVLQGHLAKLVREFDLKEEEYL